MEKLIIKQDFFASAEQLYAAFTQAEKLSQWWDAPSFLEPQVGGRYVFAKEIGDGSIRRVMGRVLEVEAGRRLRLDWAWENYPAAVSRCDIEFGPAETDGLSCVKITHDISQVQNACREGWESCLEGLYRLPEIKNADYDWSRFKKTLRLARSEADVLRAWTRSDELTKWFLSEAVYYAADGQTVLTEAVEGGRYLWKWPEGDQVEGVILSRGEKHLTFTFGTPSVLHGAELPPVRVKVEVAAQGDGTTLLTLEQFEMPTNRKAMAAWHVSCLTGWTYFFGVLKGSLEHGIDLRQTKSGSAVRA